MMGVKPADMRAVIQSFYAEPGGGLSLAFDRRLMTNSSALSSMMGSVKGEAPEPGEFIRLLQEPQSVPMSVYLHFPFCRDTCLYCGFAGEGLKSGLIEAYAEALHEEIRWLGGFPAARTPCTAVYFGGGTPTALASGVLSGLLDEVAKNFNLESGCEISLEGRTDDFDPVRAGEFAAAGFNRFSIGVQTFDTLLRRRLGRISDREKVKDTLETLTGRRLAAIIADFIYGLPGQTMDTFTEDLRQAEELGLDGLDIYQLTVFPDGPLSRAVELGSLPAPAPLSRQGAYYQAGRNSLLGAGWRQLSLSHFARTGRERNMYNSLMKEQATCLGIGAGAGGRLSGRACFRPLMAEKYIGEIRAGRFEPAFLTQVSPTRELEIFLVGQLEQGGLDLTRLYRDFGLEQALLNPLFTNWAQGGLIELTEDSLKLTEAGLFWGVNLIGALVRIGAALSEGFSRH